MNAFDRKDGYTALDWAEYYEVDHVGRTIEYVTIKCAWNALTGNTARQVVDLKMPVTTIKAMLQEEEACRQDQLSESTTMKQKVASMLCSHCTLYSLAAVPSALTAVQSVLSVLPFFLTALDSGCYSLCWSFSVSASKRLFYLQQSLLSCR